VKKSAGGFVFRSHRGCSLGQTGAYGTGESCPRAQPDDFTGSGALCSLGLIDAGLGRKEEALREGRRALELAPLAKDSMDGADVLYIYAVICAWTDEHDPSYSEIRLSPFWDPLRGDPRFEKIVASLAPR